MMGYMLNYQYRKYHKVIHYVHQRLQIHNGQLGVSYIAPGKRRKTTLIIRTMYSTVAFIVVLGEMSFWARRLFNVVSIFQHILCQCMMIDAIMYTGVRFKSLKEMNNSKFYIYNFIYLKLFVFFNSFNIITCMIINAKLQGTLDAISFQRPLMKYKMVLSVSVSKVSTNDVKKNVKFDKWLYCFSKYSPLRFSDQLWKPEFGRHKSLTTHLIFDICQ